MHKLAIATAITAALGGGAILVAAATSGGDAHAQTTRIAQPAQAPAKTGDAHACTTFGALAAAHDHAGHKAHTSAPEPPSLPPLLVAGSGTAMHAGATDCVAVGRHLAELEADLTHGPDDRPDEATCDKCAGFYTALCEKEAWSAARRTCALAAADLLNAHLCAGPGAAATAQPPARIPPSLECSALGPRLATLAQNAGMYTDIPDLHKQVETACDLGNWSLELRQCFSQATSVAAAQACLSPTK
jgi:hypothetical protein